MSIIACLGFGQRSSPRCKPEGQLHIDVPLSRSARRRFTMLAPEHPAALPRCPPLRRAPICSGRRTVYGTPPPVLQVARQPAAALRST